MSRPTGSVPRTNIALPPSSQIGGVSVNWRNCSFGGCGETTSAKSARSSSATMSASPAIAPRLCAYERQNSRSVPGAGAANGSSSGDAIASSMADARIHHAVEQIDDEIHADNDRRDEQDPSLHDGIVAR